jgi:hypothetical protein
MERDIPDPSSLARFDSFSFPTAMGAIVTVLG